MSIINPKDIETFLKEIDYNSFLPKDIDISAYCFKIATNATIILERKKPNKIKGLIAFYENDEYKKSAFITLIAVSTCHRGKGLAISLLERCLTDLKNKKFSTVSLQVNKDNTSAISLYQKFGFIEKHKEGESIKMIKKL